MDVNALISKQFNARSNRGLAPNIKINLYKGYEVEAVFHAVEDLIDMGDLRIPDCIMVADSYLNTHLNRKTTQLNKVESSFFLSFFLDLIYEVRLALNTTPLKDSVYLMADMPDGTYSNKEEALTNANEMIRYGANAVKLEVTNLSCLDIIEHLTKNKVITIAHIGYTPQNGENRTYGQTEIEVQELFSLARKSRDCGASALIIERVNETINRVLSENHNGSIPIYSVFSGVAEQGGQSLNVWDSVICPPFKATHFPPTAILNRTEFPKRYNHEIIRKQFGELMRLTLAGKFPKRTANNLQPQLIEALKSVNPWQG